MPRRSGSSLDDIVKDSIEGVVAMERAMAAGGPRPRTEITKWAADRRARRVPTFVIDMTGLKTKKAIVGKYGDGVVFEKGKPAPKTK
jgi:hypothetical protein